MLNLLTLPALRAETVWDIATLKAIRNLASPTQRASLLLDALEICSNAPKCPEKPNDLFLELASDIREIPDQFQKVELLLRLANLQEQLGREAQAGESRKQARHLALAAEGFVRRALSLKVGLAAKGQDADEGSEDLLTEGARQLDPKLSSNPAFPFTPLPAEVELGFALRGTTFRDDTARGSISIDYYSQGALEDLEINLAAALKYDSSRSENAFRPNGLGVLVYRHHLDAKWNLFFEQLATVNNDTFSSRNDNSDLSIITATLIGGGYNIWQGEKPSSFVEVRLGGGVRYQYEELDSVEIINEAAPSLAVILRAREIKIGKLRLNQNLSISPQIDELSNTFIWSTTSIKLRLTDRWSWTNRLRLLYRTEPIDDDAPGMNASFATGLTYTF